MKKKKYRSIFSFGLLSILVVALAFLLTGCGALYPPEAQISPTPAVTGGTVSVAVGEDVDFDASASTANGDATIEEYEWGFGDGDFSDRRNPSHGFGAAAA